METVQEFTYFSDDTFPKALSICIIKENKSFRIELPYGTEYEPGIAQIKNELYFTGGGKESTYLKTAKKCVMNIKNDPEKIQLPDMNIARSKHSMTTINDKFLFVVGGFNFSSVISSCERFDIEKSVWTQIASLNENRMQISVIAIEPKSLYAFGGVTNTGSKSSNMIEHLDTENASSKLWTIIKLTSGADIWPKIYFAGVLQISDDTIMIFGGIVDKNVKNTSFLFNTGKNSITKGENLASNDTFYITKPFSNKHDIIIKGKNDLHNYNTLDKKWSNIKLYEDPESGFYVKAETY